MCVTACVTALARERQNLNKQFSAFFPTLFLWDGLILCVTLGAFDLAALRKNGQSMTSKYRESDKRDWSYAFEGLSRYFDVIHWPFCIASLKVERAYSILQNHVVFYNHYAVFEVWTIPKWIQTITIPEERRRKQRKCVYRTTLLLRWTKVLDWDVVPWTLTSLTKLGFTAVDAFVTQYYTKLVCTAFYYGWFDVYRLHKFCKYIPCKLSIEKQQSIVAAWGLDLQNDIQFVKIYFVPFHLINL